MARPKTKEELILKSTENFDKMLSLIESYPSNKQEQAFPEGMLNRNIRDVLGHLHEWHLMLLDWYEVGMSGEMPEMPAKGHNWKTTPELNAEIQKKYSSTPYLDTMRLLSSSHQQVHKLIIEHSNKELFEKKRYKWTGATSLGAYLVSATSSHYDWATKLIKKSLS